MWREMDFGLFKHVNAGRWMVQDNIVMSHEGPFMVISGHGQGKVKGGGKRERKGVKMRQMVSVGLWDAALCAGRVVVRDATVVDVVEVGLLVVQR